MRNQRQLQFHIDGLRLFFRVLEVGARRAQAGSAQLVRAVFLALDPPMHASGETHRRVVVPEVEQAVVRDGGIDDVHAEVALVVAQQHAGVAVFELGIGRRVVRIAPGRQDLAVFVAVQPSGAERVPALVGELAALAAHGGHRPGPHRLRVVLLALAGGPDPVQVHDPLGVRNADLGAQANAQIVDLAPAAVGHVVVQPVDGVAVGLLRRDGHLHELDVLEQADAGVGVETVGNAVAVCVRERIQLAVAVGIRVDVRQQHAKLRAALGVKVGHAVAVHVPIRDAVSVGVLGEHQELAWFLQVVVAAVAVGVPVVQRVDGVPRRVPAAESGAVGEGAERIAGIGADDDRHVVAVEAAAVPLVQTAGKVAGVVVQGRRDDFAANLHVVVQFVLEVGHAVLLIAFLADVLPVSYRHATVVAVACPIALRAFPAGKTAQVASHEAVQEVARLVEVRVAEAGCRPVLVEGQVRVVAVGIKSGELGNVVVTGAERIAAARIYCAPRRHAPLVVAGERAAFVEPLPLDLVPVGAAVGHQRAVRAANRHRPVPWVAASGFVVSRQQLAGPVGGTDDVVRPIRELHPVLITDFQCEHQAGAFALRPGEQAKATVGSAILERLLELVVDQQTLEILARHEVDDA